MIQKWRTGSCMEKPAVILVAVSTRIWPVLSKATSLRRWRHPKMGEVARLGAVHPQSGAWRLFFFSLDLRFLVYTSLFRSMLRTLPSYSNSESSAHLSFYLSNPIQSKRLSSFESNLIAFDQGNRFVFPSGHCPQRCHGRNPAEDHRQEVPPGRGFFWRLWGWLKIGSTWVSCDSFSPQMSWHETSTRIQCPKFSGLTGISEHERWLLLSIFVFFFFFFFFLDAFPK